MAATFPVVLRSLRLALPRVLPRVLPVLSPLVALAIGIACGGLAWLLTVPALFLLRRSYGSGPESRNIAGNAEYGVGAALAGFTPDSRNGVPRR